MIWTILTVGILATPTPPNPQNTVGNGGSIVRDQNGEIYLADVFFKKSSDNGYRPTRELEAQLQLAERLLSYTFGWRRPLMERTRFYNELSDALIRFPVNDSTPFSPGSAWPDWVGPASDLNDDTIPVREFFRTQIWNNAVEFVPVERTPADCTHVVGPNDLESPAERELSQMTCTRGHFTWILPQYFNPRESAHLPELTLAEKATILIHARLHALNPFEPHDVISRFSKGVLFLQNSYMGAATKGVNPADRSAIIKDLLRAAQQMKLLPTNDEHYHIDQRNGGVIISTKENLVNSDSKVGINSVIIDSTVSGSNLEVISISRNAAADPAVHSATTSTLNSLPSGIYYSEVSMSGQIVNSIVEGSALTGTHGFIAESYLRGIRYSGGRIENSTVLASLPVDDPVWGYKDIYKVHLVAGVEILNSIIMGVDRLQDAIGYGPEYGFRATAPTYVGNTKITDSKLINVLYIGDRGLIHDTELGTAISTTQFTGSRRVAVYIGPTSRLTRVKYIAEQPRPQPSLSDIPARAILAFKPGVQISDCNIRGDNITPPNTQSPRQIFYLIFDTNGCRYNVSSDRPSWVQENTAENLRLSP